MTSRRRTLLFDRLRNRVLYDRYAEIRFGWVVLGMFALFGVVWWLTS